MSKNILLGLLGVAVVILAILILTLTSYGVACEERFARQFEQASGARQYENTQLL